MAAAATGDFAKFTAILNAFDRQYDDKVRDKYYQGTRYVNDNIIVFVATRKYFVSERR